MSVYDPEGLKREIRELLRSRSAGHGALEARLA